MMIQPASVTASRLFFIQGPALTSHPHIVIVLFPSQLPPIYVLLECQWYYH